jgi:UDP-glucose 4-epimerase
MRVRLIGKNNMKIIVTGGAGFIGSHLVDRLIKEDHQVMILDDFSSGNRELVNKKAEVTEVDVRDAEEVNKAFESFKPEAVFHLAAAVDLRESIKNPEKFHEINVKGSQNIIKASQENGVKKFIFSSTAAVYGDNQNIPIKETEPVTTFTPYGEQKAEIEEALKESGISSIILRYANVYGPRQGTVGEGGVIAIFCKLLNQGEPLKINGSGEQTRDFIFVDDIVSANIKALDTDKKFNLLNVSTSEQTSINELSQQLLTISGKSVKVEHTEQVLGEVLHNSLDNGQIRQEFGWSPQIEVNEGLKKTWEWFNKNI